MKKRIKKLFINENGNALILVVLLVMCMMLIAGGVMAVAFSHTEISQAYKRTSNLYYAAQSGAEKMVDHINKILMKEMSKLTQEAANEAKNKVAPPKPEESDESMPDPDYTDMKYSLVKDDDEEDSSLYEGEFLLNDLYQELLKEKAINTIVEKLNAEGIKFDYVLKNERNYSVVQVELTPKKESEESEKVVGFTVKSTAILKENSSPSAEEISKIILEGDIVVSDLIGHKELFLDEYRWKDENLIPNTFRSPILTFGDLVVTEGAKVTINGDVRAKGYIPPQKVIRSNGEAYPELEEYGGIYVSHGGKLTVNGDVVTLSNLHTIKKSGESETSITVTGDVFANSVVIEDDYPYFKVDGTYTDRPLAARITGQKIEINGDVYVDNDIAVDRYIKGSGSGPDITIKGSVFGVTNLDTSSNTDPDPNKSSGIYATGENTQIYIAKNAFVHGNAFISFDEGQNFSPLYESMGAPYEGVSTLDEYNNPPDSTPIYLKLFKNSIITNRIKLNLSGNYFYAPYVISAIDASGAEGKIYRGNPGLNSDIFSLEMINNYVSFDEPEELKALFNKGNVPINDLEKINSNWNKKVIEGSSYTIKDIINNGLDFLNGTNPFNRNYFTDGENNYGSMSYYRGIQGYMFIKRDIFYKGINASSAAIPVPEEMVFNGDIVSSNSDVINNLQPLKDSDTLKGWEKDNPVYICNTDDSDNQELYVESFYNNNEPVKTIIIDKGSGTITLKGSNTGKKFYGLIISNGRVVFDGVEEFTGVIISKGKTKANSDQIYTEELATGKYAGILVKDDLNISYDPNILFDIRCKNRSIKRAILDYLGLTNYADYSSNEVNEVGPILKIPSIAIENIQKVDFSPNSVLDIKNTEAYKGIRFEMKTLRQID